ncbi:hypothetical protein FACS1894188_01330 [Clostridia bacterium]|nr:hypothetical protein FACS1894188_01330 [Clostridia bacterium]
MPSKADEIGLKIHTTVRLHKDSEALLFLQEAVKERQIGKYLSVLIEEYLPKLVENGGVFDVPQNESDSRIAELENKVDKLTETIAVMQNGVAMGIAAISNTNNSQPAVVVSDEKKEETAELLKPNENKQDDADEDEDEDDIDSILSGLTSKS